MVRLAAAAVVVKGSALPHMDGHPIDFTFTAFSSNRLAKTLQCHNGLSTAQGGSGSFKYRKLYER